MDIFGSIYPVVIKAKISEENFIALFKELSVKYPHSWLKKTLRYDGIYLYFDDCSRAYGNQKDCCPDHVLQILRRCTSTNEQMGIIFNGDFSYQIADFYFVDGKIVKTNSIVNNHPRDYESPNHYARIVKEIEENNHKIYLERKKQFMPDFPKDSTYIKSFLKRCDEESWKHNKITISYEKFLQTVNDIAANKRYTVLCGENDYFENHEHFTKNFERIYYMMPSIMYTDGIRKWDINDIGNPILSEICSGLDISLLAIYSKNWYQGNVEIYFNK